MSVSTSAISLIEKAFKRLEGSITPDDSHTFSSTQLSDVRQTALEIEKLQRSRGSVRNLRRIDPFLKGIEEYSKVIEILCNGTPFLPWIWVRNKSLHLHGTLD